MTKIQIIKEDGRPAFAVLPWDEFKTRLEAALTDEELADLAEQEMQAQETWPQHVMERLAAGDNPIQVIRKYRGMTQAELASEAGISSLYLSQIETGNRSGSAKTLQAVARALDVDLDDIV